MGFRISVDTGGTFTDVVVADDDGTLTIGKALTDARARLRGHRAAALARSPPALGLTVEELLGRREVVHLRHDARHERDRRGQDRAHRVLHHGGLPRHPAPARGRQARPVPPGSRTRRPTSRASSPSRSRERIDSEGDGVPPARRGQRPRARSTRRRALGVRGDRGLPALVDRQPRPRAARRRADRRATAGRALHALAPAQPDRARVPARFLDGHRRVAEAADAGAPARPRARPARGRASPGNSSSPPRSAARGDRTRSSSGRSTRSAPGPSMAPVAALTYGGAELGGRRRRRQDILVCDTGGTTFDVGLVSGGADQLHGRDLAGRALDRPHHRHPRGRREVASARAAARSPGSTRADSCASARRVPAPTRARPATAAAARSRPSPTPRSCSATSTRDYFLGGRLSLDAEAARAAIARAVAAPLGWTVEEAA